MLSISALHVSGNRRIPILKGISLAVERGSCVALTGPSGSGKTTLIRSILGMDSEKLHMDSGDISLDGKTLLSLSSKERRVMCGKTFGFIPQTPMTAFFRNFTIGSQVTETLRLHTGLGKTRAMELARECLQRVNLTDTKRMLGAYPAQLSGGMLQRVTMAIILGTEPAYILADEPTSALDEENRELLLELLRQYGKTAGILFISHDDEAMCQLCESTYVMQDGRIIEAKKTDELFSAPGEAWTRSFVAAAKQHQEGGEAWKQLW